MHSLEDKNDLTHLIYLQIDNAHKLVQTHCFIETNQIYNILIRFI